MSGQIITTATGVQEFASTTISWEQEMDGPVGSGNVLLAFIGAVDSQKPDIVSANMSGTAVSPLTSVPLTTAIGVNGAGGSSFPCAWILMVGAPVSVTGTVTGTISVVFDEIVGRMQGMSAVLSGTTGDLDGGPTYLVQHTQSPDFSISGSYTTTATASIVVDMCMAESSNHNDHTVGSGQNQFGFVLFSGPSFSTSFKDVPVASTVGMTRSQIGGPFAGVNLLTLGLEGE